MAVTIIPFLPTANQAFQFSPVLDGTTYAASVPWNLSGQRFYLTLNTLDGSLVVCRPLIGSLPIYDLDLLMGLGFTQHLIFRSSTGNFEVGP